MAGCPDLRDPRADLPDAAVVLGEHLECTEPMGSQVVDSVQMRRTKRTRVRFEPVGVFVIVIIVVKFEVASPEETSDIARVQVVGVEVVREIDMDLDLRWQRAFIVAKAVFFGGVGGAKHEHHGPLPGIQRKVDALSTNARLTIRPRFLQHLEALSISDIAAPAWRVAPPEQFPLAFRRKVLHEEAPIPKYIPLPVPGLTPQ